MSALTSEQYKLGWFYTKNTETNSTETIYTSSTTFDTLDSTQKIDFLRGVFDRRSNILLRESISISTDYINEQMLTEISASYVIEDDKVMWYAINALELLAFIYSDVTKNPLEHSSQKNYSMFVSWTMPNDVLRLKPPSFKWSRINDTVPPPSKNRFSDSGYDLHLVSKLKEDVGVHYYDTGIRVEPENGYYFELVGRSSISKTGWMLANNIGIIDASYRGTIIVPLVRINPFAPPLNLPIRLVQIIPRQLILMVGTETDTLTNTTRGSGGFGSSGK